jgi:hypothetical protein
MPGPITVSRKVYDLLNELKSSSVGVEQSKCDPAAVVLLEDLGLARVQGEDVKNNHPARVKALPAAWEVAVLSGG